MEKTKECRACGKPVKPTQGIRIVASHQFRGILEPFFAKNIKVCPECGERDI
jgi:predicted RNA-binding Zn-ribbon protein involved in translation (DUF1610 family)